LPAADRPVIELQSLGGLVGFAYPPADAPGAAVAVETARNIWLFQYMLVVEAAFVGLVGWLLPQRWFRWSVAVSALIVFLLWFQVQLDVMINNWFGTFYNMVQQALAKPGAITQEQFFGQLVTFGGIAMVYIMTAVLTAFITSHYVFRWRTAMNDWYVAHWQRLRHIEGASQRIQEDTQKFAQTVEGLGASLIEALLTLIAFRSSVMAAVTVWEVSPTYSHCFLILPIVLWLLWEKRPVLESVSPALMPPALLAFNAFSFRVNRLRFRAAAFLRSASDRLIKDRSLRPERRSRISRPVVPAVSAT